MGWQIGSLLELLRAEDTPVPEADLASASALWDVVTAPVAAVRAAAALCASSSA